MSEGLGFNLCVAPFLNICVPNLTKGQKSKMVGSGWSWVRDIIQEMDGRELSQRGNESEDRCGLMNIQTSKEYRRLLFKRLNTAGLACLGQGLGTKVLA